MGRGNGDQEIDGHDPPERRDHDVGKRHGLQPRRETLFTGEASGVIKLWNVKTGLLRSQLRGHLGAVIRLVFSADGRTLYSVGWEDHSLKQWDPWREQGPVRIAAGGGRQHVALLDQHSLLAYGALAAMMFPLRGTSVPPHIFDLTTGLERDAAKVPPGTVNDVSQGPAATFVLLLDDWEKRTKIARIWNPQTNQVREIPWASRFGEISPSGRWLSEIPEKGALAIHDAFTGKIQATWKGVDGSARKMFSPRDDTLAICLRDKVVFRNLPDGAVVDEIPDASVGFIPPAFNSDGRFFVFITGQRGDPMTLRKSTEQIVVWDVARRAVCQRITENIDELWPWRFPPTANDWSRRSEAKAALPKCGSGT